MSYDRLIGVLPGAALFGLYVRNLFLQSIASVGLKDGKEEWALLTVEAGYSLFFKKRSSR